MIICSTLIAESEKWQCAEGFHVPKAVEGKLRWIDQTEMLRRVVRRTSPKFPKAFRVEACITVDVMVTPTGTVGCVRANEGHPLLRAAAIEALKDWTFQPRQEEGQRTSYLGRVDIPFSSSEKNPCGGKRRVPGKGF